MGLQLGCFGDGGKGSGPGAWGHRRALSGPCWRGTHLLSKGTQRNQLHRCCQGPSLTGRGEAGSDVGEQLSQLSLGWTPVAPQAPVLCFFLLLPGACSAWHVGLPSADTEK